MILFTEALNQHSLQAVVLLISIFLSILKLLNPFKLFQNILYVSCKSVKITYVSSMMLLHLLFTLEALISPFSKKLCLSIFLKLKLIS